MRFCGFSICRVQNGLFEWTPYLPFRNFSFIGALALFLFFHAALAEQGDDSALIQLRAQHSYNAVFGLPAVAARPVQTSETQISIEHSNQFVGGENGDESLILDGESSELVIRHRQRLSACWQVETHIPFISHGGGEFDRAIDDWHQFFGLPDANRESVAFRQINYRYQNSSGNGPSVSAPQSGIGDVQVSIQRSLGCFATADTTGAEPTVRLGVKLPSGNPSELRGSGKSDVFADIQSPVWRVSQRWHLGANLGIIVLGDSKHFDVQRQSAAYATGGALFRLSHRYRIIAQLDWHTPFYRSSLTELGNSAISLSVGARILLPSNQSIELSISEDLAVDTAPDIVARIAWIYRP